MISDFDKYPPWEEYLDDVSVFMADFCSRFEIPHRNQAELADVMKEFGAVYHLKIQSGEIPKEKQYHRDQDGSTIDKYNELLGQLGEEL